MLENSVWRKYNDELRVQDALSKIYGCEIETLISDDVEVYNIIKKYLTKKELRSFAMGSAGISNEEIMSTLKVNKDELELILRKSSRKIRQGKIRDSVKNTQSEIES
jgi:hypothetical protein